MIIMCKDKGEMAAFKAAMKDKFKMELGPIAHYLKICIVRDRANKHVYLLQDHFFKRILRRFNMEECKPLGTPLSVAHRLSKRMEDEAPGDEPYASLVGSVMYSATGTRPDLAYANGLLARYMATEAHAERHWKAGKRLLHYLQGTKGLGLRLGGDSIKLKGWCDASLGDCTHTAKSTLGFFCTLGDRI